MQSDGDSSAFNDDQQNDRSARDIQNHNEIQMIVKDSSVEGLDENRVYENSFHSDLFVSNES